MTELTGKFTDLTDQLSIWHTTNTDQLDAILSALGGAPTDTFSALTAAVTALNTTLAAIHSDNNAKLDAIFNILDTMNNNNSLNAQRILTLMLQTSCPCDTTTPLLPPVLGTTPIDATLVAKCQRVQYFIDFFRTWVIDVGQYVGTHDNISSFAVNNLLQLHLEERGITTGQLASYIPTSQRDIISSLLNNAAGTYGASAVDSTLFNAMIDANIAIIRQELYGTDSAVDGKSAFDAIINTMAIPVWAVAILRTMFYSSWANDLYSATPIVDASAYDGTICVENSDLINITTCTQYNSTRITADGYEWEAVMLTPPTSFYPWTVAGDFYHWSFTAISNGYGHPWRLYTFNGSGDLNLVSLMADGSERTIIDHCVGIAMITVEHDSNAVPFVVEICPPT